MRGVALRRETRPNPDPDPDPSPDANRSPDPDLDPNPHPHPHHSPLTSHRNRNPDPGIDPSPEPEPEPDPRCSAADLQRETRCSVLQGALPEELAESLLDFFIDESAAWKQGSRFIYDRKITSERLATGFSIPDTADSNGVHRPSHRDKRWAASGAIDEISLVRDIVARLVSATWCPRRTDSCISPASMHSRDTRARTCTKHPSMYSTPGHAYPHTTPANILHPLSALKVRSERAERREAAALAPGRKSLERLYPLAVKSWQPNFCAGNLYRDGNDYTGPHSDPLVSLGPHCIIGSLSLGAARRFKLTPALKSHQKAEGVASSFTVVLPHNSLLVMWEGCQEAFRHEVPRMTEVAEHPRSGVVRANLTFRQRRWEWWRRAPTCKCGVRCNLKPVLKDGRNKGRYCWLCSSRKQAGCGFFEWDDQSSLHIL